MEVEPMTDQPGTGPTVPPEDAPAEPSTEVVVLDPRRPLPAPRRWPEAVVRVRSRLVALREHPAAPVVVSTAATVGSALLTAGLRRVLRGSALPVPGRSSSVTLRGYIRHEVHIVHHVVHHVVPPAQRWIPPAQR
jgi:hypothetical protein